MDRARSEGFTLTEIMISLVIAIVVFSAMGVLLTRCFSMWVDAQAHWKLAQHARVTRSRLLNGAFGIGSGFLNADNVTIGEWSGWKTIRFEPVTESGYFQLYGWPGASKQNLWIYSSGDGAWAWAQENRFASGANPLVSVNKFDASVTNDQLTIAYTLNFSAMGKNFELPQLIEARLVNE